MSHDPLTQAEIHRVAMLARLDLSPEEESQAARDFEHILKHVDLLHAANTHGVEPTSHALVLDDGWRQDTPHDSLPVEEVLKNAPERLGDGFGVPKIIE